MRHFLAGLVLAAVGKSEKQAASGKRQAASSGLLFTGVGAGVCWGWDEAI